MARRKRKHYGSPPEVHERQAGKDARRTSKLAHASMRHAAGGRCSVALGLLITAAEYAGQTAAEGRGATYSTPKIAGRGRRALRLGFRSDSAVDRARTKFFHACVKAK